MMRIGMAADLHGNLISIPSELDLFIIAGDFVPANIHPKDYFKHMKWLGNEFHAWLKTANCPIVLTKGNHELIFEQRPEMIPELPVLGLDMIEGLIEFQELRIWMQSNTPRFYDWAFNLDEEDLWKRWERTPINIDIVVSHGPPRGFCDWTTRDGRQGSASLTDYIYRAEPDIVVCGHLHFSYGVEWCGDTAIINCAICDDNYEPNREIIVVDYEKGRKPEVLNI